MEKTLTIFAGINGAGKSTLYRFKTSQEMGDLGVRICPDEILEDFGGDWSNRVDVFNSGRIAINEMDYCLEEGLSFNWETTIISPFFLRLAERAKSCGYKIDLHFIGVDDVNQSLERIRKRVLNGGHGIDANIVASRHKNQLNNMIEAFKYVDNAIFYDNSNTLKVVSVYFDQGLHIYNENFEWVRALKKQFINVNEKVFKN